MSPASPVCEKCGAVFLPDAQGAPVCSAVLAREELGLGPPWGHDNA